MAWRSRSPPSLFGVFAVIGLTALPAIVGAVDLPGWLGETLVQLAFWPVLVLGFVLGLAVLYRHGPDRENAEWRWVSWGSVVAVVVWIVASILFRIYAANFGSYDQTYGSLAAVVVLLLWLYITAFVVLLGAQVNAEIEHQTAVDTTTRPRPTARAARCGDGRHDRSKCGWFGQGGFRRTGAGTMPTRETEVVHEPDTTTTTPVAPQAGGSAAPPMRSEPRLGTWPRPRRLRSPTVGGEVKSQASRLINEVALTRRGSGPRRRCPRCPVRSGGCPSELDQMARGASDGDGYLAGFAREGSSVARRPVRAARPGRRGRRARRGQALRPSPSGRLPRRRIRRRDRPRPVDAQHRCVRAQGGRHPTAPTSGTAGSDGGQRRAFGQGDTTSAWSAGRPRPRGAPGLDRRAPPAHPATGAPACGHSAGALRSHGGTFRSGERVDAMSERYAIDEPDRSLGDLVGDLTSEFGALVTTHIDLAKAEIKQDIRDARRREGCSAWRPCRRCVALIMLSAAAGWGLAEVMAPGWAFLIVGALWAVVGRRARH